MVSGKKNSNSISNTSDSEFQNPNWTHLVAPAQHGLFRPNTKGEVERGEREREGRESSRARAARREEMSGEVAAAVGGGAPEENGAPPNVTIYINNLNEKIKLEGTYSCLPHINLAKP